MAKTGVWLRGAKGKLAGNSLSKGANGQTIIREIVTPSNPKTAAQCLQRMVFNTASQAASAMSQIIDHSFEGVKYGSDSINRFMSENIDWLRTAALEEVEGNGVATALYNLKGFNYAQENNYIISKGSLPFPSYSIFRYNDAGGEGYDLADMPAVAQYANSIVRETDYKKFLSYFGLQPGDQITVVTLECDPDSEYSQQMIADDENSWVTNSKCLMNFKRVVFKTTAPDGPFIDQRDFGPLCFSFKESIIDTKRSSSLDEIFIVSADGHFGWSIAPKSGRVIVAIGVIRSKRSVKGKWLRSNAVMSQNADMYAQAKYASISYGNVSAASLGSDYVLDNAIGTGDYTETYSQGDIVANPEIVSTADYGYNSMSGPIDSDEAVVYVLNPTDSRGMQFKFAFDSMLDAIQVTPSVVNAGRTIEIAKSGSRFVVTVTYTAQSVSFRSETLTIKKTSGTAIYRVFVRQYT